MFIDCVQVKISAGKGGNGIISWRREKFIPKGGPTGGNGGPGGSIIFRTDPHVLSLEDYRHKKILLAEDGRCGGPNRQNGRMGKDLIIKVPPGTLIKDKVTKEILFDFDGTTDEWIACKGGRGGIGNFFFRSPTNQAPNKCTPGKEGESLEVELELKLIADIGLVGIPNAGKSSLMKKIARIEVKVGAYPFTTLHPNLACIQFEDYSRILLADIPGIIEGAHEDKGLGLAFLRHIERSSSLIYVIDISGEEGRNPLDDFRTLRNEIGCYSQEILEKPFFVVLNKIDKENAKENAKEFRKECGLSSDQILEVSAETEEGLKDLLKALEDVTSKLGAKRFF